MSRATSDPLNLIPSPEVIRHSLQEAERKVEKLRILLEVSERIHAVDAKPGPSGGNHASK